MTNLIPSSVLFSSVQDGIDALGKAHMRSTRLYSIRSFPNVALETVSVTQVLVLRFFMDLAVTPTFRRVPMLVWLTMSLSRPLREDR